MPAYRGQKWLTNARYINDETRRIIAVEMDAAKAQGFKSVGVRCGTYIGEPSPIAAVTVMGGGCIYSYIYQTPEFSYAR